ncbi:M61 family metallopeptidase [Pistricoccus aurantiacus]|uniref:M61 family metallopeptidase n=1 Tax=Pistricoccus aurantiacus TaxID=1883414 RepID=A0A5B8SQU8_9GAMM|nr:M61 family metallopeptidase [Pistricoccus aurantiacus]QEA39512.1 M61 family metallopeptidase [Pistricoccus aurantiacus]
MIVDTDRAPIRLHVDATDIARGIFRIEETVPLETKGDIILSLAKWLPAYHASRGGIDLLAGLRIEADGNRCSWTRDPGDAFRFLVDVPRGADRLMVRFQALTPTDSSQGRVLVSDDMLRLQWSALCLYPADMPVDDIRVEAVLRLPAGWIHGTALDVKEETSERIAFSTTDLRTLIDSPVLAGRYAHIERLASDVRLTIVADRADQLPRSREMLHKHRRLVAEADALFVRRPFRRYEFLMSLSDQIGRSGLEHRASSENGVRATYFSDWERSTTEHDLLPHEYTHSWIGKYRVPAGNLQPDFSCMTNELMWVYEGLTQFYGHVLAARSGLISNEQTLGAFALIFTTYDSRPGRQWRPLVDTDMDPIFAARKPQPWRSWQRSEDYYSEGLLIWLEADMLIRTGTKGRRSLDDFVRAFFAPPAGAAPQPPPVPYTRADVIATMSDVFAYDWEAFFAARVDRIAERAPYGGITLGGYRLAWRKSPSDWQSHDQHHHHYFDFTYSLGMQVGSKARIIDVLWDGPAFKAGLVRDMKILAVAGRGYSHGALRDAIDMAQDGNSSIELTVRRLDHVKTVRIEWDGGQRYPVLEAASDTPRHLDALLAPRVDPEPQDDNG